MSERTGGLGHSAGAGAGQLPRVRIGDDEAMADYLLPRIPASAGGLIGDGSGLLLILKPTYKAGWTIPGRCG